MPAKSERMPSTTQPQSASASGADCSQNRQHPSCRPYEDILEAAKTRGTSTLQGVTPCTAAGDALGHETEGQAVLQMKRALCRCAPHLHHIIGEPLHKRRAGAAQQA